VDQWTKIREHNEALDIRVLNLAALIVANVDLNKLSDEMEKKHPAKIKDETKPVEEKKPEQPKLPQQPAKRVLCLQNPILKRLRRNGGVINDFWYVTSEISSIQEVEIRKFEAKVGLPRQS
jgi:hypothetical protein